MPIKLCAFLLGGLISSQAIATEQTDFVSLTPDVSPHYSPTENLEAGLWMQVEKIEEKLKHSPHRITDPELNNYVNDMVCRLSKEYCADIRVYITRQPYFNASMWPNGMMVIWSGLLLRVENEDQLAAIIGHEIGHYLKRHSMKRYQDAKDKSAFSAFLSLGLAAAGVGYVGSITDFMLQASIFSHSREHEHEADKYGAQLMQSAGYEVIEASTVWENIIKEDEAAKEHGKDGVAFFATHPPPEDRFEKLKTYAEQLPRVKPMEEQLEFSGLVAPFIGEFLRDQIQLNHPQRSEFLLNQLKEKQISPGIVYYYEGELYRYRKEEGDLAKAEKAYLEALNHEDAPKQTYRDLGVVLLKQKKFERARHNFRTYLKIADDAKDREMVEFYLAMEM